MKSLGDFLAMVTGGGSNGVVGIDIGSSAIKIVELQDRDGVPTLTTYGELQLGPYVDKQLGESVVLNTDKEQAALTDLLKESAVSVQEAVFAMPLSSSFVTNVGIEAPPDADLSSMVRVEARKVIPASLSEVTLDWAEVEAIGGSAKATDAASGVSFNDEEGEKKSKKDKANEPITRNVLVAAIQNAALSRFKTLMKFAGLNEPPTEIECFSAIRSVYDSDEPDVAVIDIGADASKLYIMHKGLLMRMHRVRAGGVIATRSIADALNVSFVEAEALKFAADSSHEQFAALKRAHNNSYLRAFREFGQVLREYERKTGVKISKLYVSGGGALFPGVDAMLADVLQRDIETANPFARVAYPAFMEDTLAEIGPSFVVSLGAALRNFE